MELKPKKVLVGGGITLSGSMIFGVIGFLFTNLYPPDMNRRLMEIEIERRMQQELNSRMAQILQASGQDREETPLLVDTMPVSGLPVGEPFALDEPPLDVGIVRAPSSVEDISSQRILELAEDPEEWNRVIQQQIPLEKSR